MSYERSKVAQQIMDEKLGTAYATLIAYFPSARERFLGVNARLADIESQEIDQFLLDSQATILSFEGKRASYTTAMLGNALRSVAASHEDSLKKKSEAAVQPVRDYLLQVIDRSDADIVQVSRPQKPKDQDSSR